MDAKTRASFVNSVAGGDKIPCPQCNTLNEAGSSFCMLCGTKLGAAKPAAASAAPFAPVEAAPAAPEAPARPAAPAAPFAAVEAVQPAAVKAAAAQPALQAEEPESIFAEGLPDWDVVPPQVMVRRKRGK